jgi:predicted DsbA family dithiol-disulfide isomerase
MAEHPHLETTMIGPGLTKISPEALRQSPATLQVDVIADLACPWCYLGKQRLDEALSAVHGPSVVTWYPFQVNPSLPADGMRFHDYVASRFGDPETLQPAIDDLTAVGRSAGIDFRFDLIERVPNTLNAHRLMQAASEKGSDPSRLAALILRGFFTEGLDISDPDVLAGIGETCGLDRLDVLTALEDKRMRTLVLAQESQVRASGVTGVPDFLVNKRLLVMGVQQTKHLVSVFDRAMFGKESDLPVSATVH